MIEIYESEDTIIDKDQLIKNIRNAEFQPVKPRNKYAAAYQAKNYVIKIPNIGNGEIEYFIKRDGKIGAYAFVFDVQRKETTVSEKCDSPDEARKVVRQGLIDIVNNSR